MLFHKMLQDCLCPPRNGLEDLGSSESPADAAGNVPQGLVEYMPCSAGHCVEAASPGHHPPACDHVRKRLSCTRMLQHIHFCLDSYHEHLSGQTSMPSMYWKKEVQKSLFKGTAADKHCSQSGEAQAVW